MSDAIPDDVLRHIFARLPQATLAEVQLVSREWRQNIRSNEVGMALFEREKHREAILMVSNKEKLIAVIYRDVILNRNSRPSWTHLHFPYPGILFPVQRIVGSCRGLVCLIDRTGMPVVINPRTLRICEVIDDKRPGISYAIGWKKIRDSTGSPCSVLVKLLDRAMRRVAILNLDTNEWTLHEPQWQGTWCAVEVNEQSAFVNGNFLWLGTVFDSTPKEAVILYNGSDNSVTYIPLGLWTCRQKWNLGNAGDDRAVMWPTNGRSLDFSEINISNGTNIPHYLGGSRYDHGNHFQPVCLLHLDKLSSSPEGIILRQFRHLYWYHLRYGEDFPLYTQNPSIDDQSEQLLMGLRLNHLRDTDTRRSLNDLDATLLNPTQLNHRTTEQASLMSPPDSLPELSQAESERESSLESIFQRLGQFCERHIKWRQLVSVTADMDVFVLAIASDYYEGRPTCRPFIKSSSDEVPLFANSLGHPVIRSDPLGKGIFVPNDITLRGTGHASFILLTNPNMGRKSTLRGQVCLSVILTQLGADMPAKSFELSLVDPILVRMGAKDHIMVGQSTFLTELSEIATMLSSATRNSLVAPDELGRGTSTSDGQAIVQLLLEHFVDKVHCRGMFSTHYRRLVVDYQKFSQVSLWPMACQIGNGDGDGDGGVEEVTFLYRLTCGACPKIYVVNVARLAGLPRSVLQKTAAKAKEFEAAYYKHLEQTEDSFPLQTSIEKMVECIQHFTNTVAKLPCQESSEETDIDCRMQDC